MHLFQSLTLKRTERDQSDLIMLVFRALLWTIMFLSTQSSAFGAPSSNAIVILIGLAFLNIVILQCYVRGFACREFWVVLDALWVLLWLWQVGGTYASNFFVLLLFVAMEAAMWFRLLAGFTTAAVGGIAYLLIMANSDPDNVRRIFLADLPALFLGTLVVAHVTEIRAHAQTEQKKFGDIAEAYARDLQDREKFQETLLPKSVPHVAGLEIGKYYRKGVAEIGGDYHDFAEVGADRLLAAVGDVAGKGGEALIKVALVKYAFRVSVTGGGGPREVMTRLNQTVMNDLNPNDFVALCLVEVNSQTNKIAFCNAGTVPPLIVRSDGSIIEIKAGGVPLGITTDVGYSQEEYEIRNNDLIVLATDGVTNARNHYGEEFGIGRLKKFVRTTNDISPDMLARTITEEVGAFSKPGELDDLTVVVLRLRHSE